MSAAGDKKSIEVVGGEGGFHEKNVTPSLPRDAPLIEKERPQQRRLSQRGRFLSGKLGSAQLNSSPSLLRSCLRNLVSSHFPIRPSKQRSFVSKSWFCYDAQVDSLATLEPERQCYPRSYGLPQPNVLTCYLNMLYAPSYFYILPPFKISVYLWRLSKESRKRRDLEI